MCDIIVVGSLDKDELTQLIAFAVEHKKVLFDLQRSIKDEVVEKTGVSIVRFV